MWPFNKQSQSDKALEVMDEATAVIAEKWHMFQTSLAFKDGVGLGEQISMFAIPLMEGLRKRFPVLKQSPDDVLFLFMIEGIKRSGTHSEEEIAGAFGTDTLDESTK